MIKIDLVKRIPAPFSVDKTEARVSYDDERGTAKSIRQGYAFKIFGIVLFRYKTEYIIQFIPDRKVPKDKGVPGKSKKIRGFVLGNGGYKT